MPTIDQTTQPPALTGFGGLDAFQGYGNIAPAQVAATPQVNYNAWTAALAQNAPEVQAQNWNAQTANLGQSLQSLGAIDPTQAYQQQLSGNVSNPYLAQQAQGLQAMSNQNLMQNIMPQIGQGAMMAGQYGGSRQGIAQGVAMGNAQTGLNSQIANLFGSAYEAAQNRQGQAAQQLGSLGAQTGLANAGFQNQAGLANQATNLAASTSNASNSLATNLANAGFQNTALSENARNQLSADSLNASNTQAVNLANAGFTNNANLANQAAYNQLGMSNLGLGVQYDLGVKSNANQATSLANQAAAQSAAAASAQRQANLQSQQLAQQAAAQQAANDLAQQQFAFNSQNTGLLTNNLLSNTAFQNQLAALGFDQGMYGMGSNIYTGSGGAQATGTSTAASNPVLSGLGLGLGAYNAIYGTGA